MSKSSDIIDLYKSKVMPAYSPSIVIAGGKGVTVRDADGMSYYDFTSGIGVNALGYGNKKVIEAIQSQAAALCHCSNLFVNAPATLLASKLVELSGLGGKVFFANSGAEANEAAIKLARKWGSQNGGRYEIVTFRQGFHGRTLATLAATAQAWCQEGYDPLPVGFAYADFNDLESVKAAIGDKTVAIMLEAVQGEGGVIPATDEFMKGIRALCDEKDLLMIVDEVQTGIGRTGKWFAWQNFDVKPDLFTCAKALGGGLPLSALVSNEKLANVFTASSHASTFGGNPVAAAAANALISVIEEENLLENCVKVGAVFKEKLEEFADQYDKLLDVRGMGLMLGIVTEGPASELVEAFRSQGLLTLTAGEHVVRLLPPLTLTEADLESEVFDMISEALDCTFGEG